MDIKKNYSLKKLNAFHVDVKAKYFVRVKNDEQFSKLIKNDDYKDEKKFILGEGSSTFFTKDFEGLIIKPEIYGINKISDDQDSVILEVGASDIWHDLVMHAVENNWSGIENMSLIPGTVGAAPVHNIAAYGQNFEDVLVSLDAINLDTGQRKTFTKSECKLGYRDSIFKNDLRNKYLITKVRIKLNKVNKKDLSYHSRYGSLESELEKFANKPYTLKDISEAVIRIRSEKFPDWKKKGNTGSYFKNPVISKQKLKILLEKYPNLQYYPVNKLTYPKPNDPDFDHSKYVKIPAGWLLEEIGWKGKRIGKVGTSPNQSLVIINYGGATAQEILDFADKMKKDFKKNFDIELEPEVNIV